MLKILPKIIPALIFGAIFILEVLQVPYPETLTQANILQILGFFIPLFLAISFIVNLFINNIFSSASISLGINILLILKALGSLNIVTAILVIISVGLFVSYFRKIKGRSLTKLPKVPKLTHWRKQKQ